MALTHNADFLEINTSVLRRISGPLPFDIFIKRAENSFTRLFPRGETLDFGRMESYESLKGITSFFVFREDYNQYLSIVEKIAAKLLEKTAAQNVDELGQVLKELTHLTMIEILGKGAVSDKSAQQAAVITQGCVELLSKKPSALFKVFRLMLTHPYLIRHSISTTIFALLLSKLEGMESPKSLMAIGLGALLHDVGTSRLAFDPEAKENLTPEDWKEIKQHPELGKRLLDPIRLVPTEARLIVLQHHEQPNGGGYPNGLHDKEIYYPAKIVAIADSFSSLTSKRPFREEANSPLKALEIMNSDQGKLDSKLLRTFSKIFVSLKEG